jgi:hypothetical protein
LACAAAPRIFDGNRSGRGTAGALGPGLSCAAAAVTPTIFGGNRSGRGGATAGTFRSEDNG